MQSSLSQSRTLRDPYFGWALDALEGLDWLVEIDDRAFEGDRANLSGRDPRVVDLAHIRWAASSAKTALDLCAAELAYRLGELDFWSDKVPTLDQVARRLKDKDAPISKSASKWLEGVMDDPDFVTLAHVRHALTHRFLVRTALIVIRPPRDHEERTRLEVDPEMPAFERPDARELILLCRDVVKRHIDRFDSIFTLPPAPPPPRPGFGP